VEGALRFDSRLAELTALNLRLGRRTHSVGRIWAMARSRELILPFGGAGYIVLFAFDDGDVVAGAFGQRWEEDHRHRSKSACANERQGYAPRQVKFVAERPTAGTRDGKQSGGALGL
jgi:hypothetical protein